MATVFLLLGSNLGDKLQHFKKVLKKIEMSAIKIEAKSAIYSSKSWGYSSDNEFFNAVVQLETELHPDDLLILMQNIEQELGRERINSKVKGYSDRIIDIDILYYDDLVYKSKILEIPHPRLQERKFTLLPLCELIPNFMHPVLRNSNLELLVKCSDKNVVIKCENLLL